VNLSIDTITRTYGEGSNTQGCHCVLASWITDDDAAVGKALEALSQAGGFFDLMPHVDGLNAEEALRAAERAEKLGYISTLAPTSASG